MERYDRQIRLPEIGTEGQQRLGESRVAIIGVGALGTVSAELLARAGVGTLLLVDTDIVELSNLQRQTLFTEEDVGRQKALAAAERLRAINSTLTITPIGKHLTVSTTSLLDDVDLILDCTDNLQTRFLLNEYAMREKLPFIYCGAVATRGMVYVVDPTSERPCFSCIFDSLKSLENCEDFGVLNVTTQFAATLQATEALKLLVNAPYRQGLVAFDTWTGACDEYLVRPRSACPVCQGKYERLSGTVDAIEYCVTNRSVKVRPQESRGIELSKLKEEHRVVAEYTGALRVEIDGTEVLVSQDGFLEVATRDQDVARRIAEQLYSS